jgi:hypothetical protein
MIHPDLFRLHMVSLTGSGLLLAYSAASGPHRPLRPRRIALVSDQGEVPVTEVEHGLLHAPDLPPGDRLTLRVEQVENHRPGLPPLPWTVEVPLPAEAARDYRESQPCEAALSFPQGGELAVRRLLRRPDRTVLFLDHALTRPDPLEMAAWLLVLEAGSLRLVEQLLPYNIAPSMGRIHALCFAGAPAGLPLTLLLYPVNGDGTTHWSVPLDLPPERPMALWIDRPLTESGLPLHLVEAWFGRTGTALSLRIARHGLGDALRGLELVAETGERLMQQGSSWSGSEMEIRLEPVPPGIGRLYLRGVYPPLDQRPAAVLPLFPGARRMAENLPDFELQRKLLGGFARGVRAGEIDQVDLPASPLASEAEPDEEADEAPVIIPALEAWLKERALPSYRLLLQSADPAHLDPRSSHLGGPPFLPAGEEWPRCPSCGAPFSFIGQVRLDEAGLAEGPTLLTFFCCHACLWTATECALFVRLHSGVDQSPLAGATQPDADANEPYPMPTAPCSVALQPATSLPHWEDAQPEVAGLNLGPRPWSVYADTLQRLTQEPNTESHLGGYPGWIQGPEWPSCPHCGQPMRLLWQLDSEPEADLMWGDVGRVYIFGCRLPCRPDVLRTVIQCA